VILSLDTASLRIIGTGGRALIDESGAPNVEALGFVEDLGPHYRSSRLVLAPARSGGGSQLKVSEALSHGRVVVGSPHLNSRGGGSSTSEFVVGVDDMAHQIVSLLRNWEDRHRRERAAVHFTSQRGWEQTLHPISEVVSSLTARATS
jgi:glycosyltransferase involved in cell wall biosynthesis